MGGGVAAMHYLGMAAMRIDGSISYDRNLVAASVIVAVVAATAALWCAVALEGWASITVASAIFAVAVCAMHYTGMAAVQVHLSAGVDVVHGVSPVVLVVPIVVIAIAALLGLVFGALTMMGDEEFRLGVNREVMDGVPTRLGGAADRRAAAVLHPGSPATTRPRGSRRPICPRVCPHGRAVPSAALRSHRNRG